MSEGIDLPTLPRETLLDEDRRVERLDLALPQIRAAVEGETDPIVIQATLACLLFEACVQTNWCGFYRRVAPRELAVGPYQGTMGCLRISFDRGVCGKAASTGQIVLVPDVEAFADHIACDARSRSELVVPFFGGGELRGVLDLDSPHVNAFSMAEGARLRDLLGATLGAPSVRW
jgi:GAF domain-containing protein